MVKCSWYIINQRLLDECRQNLEGLIGKQHELERMLEAERRDSQKMRMQLQVAVEAVQQCGEQRAAASPELSRLRIELEVAVRERDCLKDQTRSCQVVSCLRAKMKSLNIFSIIICKLVSIFRVYLGFVKYFRLTF
jgi:hypothetical protein